MIDHLRPRRARAYRQYDPEALWPEGRVDRLRTGVLSGQVAVVMVNRLVDADGHSAIAALVTGLSRKGKKTEPEVERVAIVLSTDSTPAERLKAAIGFESELRSINMDGLGDSAADAEFMRDVTRVLDERRSSVMTDYAQFSPLRYSLVISRVARRDWAAL